MAQDHENNRVRSGDGPLVDVLVAGVHDAKNVIFDAKTRVDVARAQLRAGEPADVLPLLDEAASALDRAASGFSTVLSAYRLERHENPVALLPTVVGDLMQEVLLRAGAAPGSSVPEFEMLCGCTQLWLLDRELIEEALVNAIQNAGRFARRHVSFVCETIDDWLNLRVEDDGPGFSDEPPTRRGRGTGIGLIVGARIAALHERHGRAGRLELYNGGAHGGAVFSLWLPG